MGSAVVVQSRANGVQRTRFGTLENPLGVDVRGTVTADAFATALAKAKSAALFVPRFGNVFQDSAGTTPAVADDPVGLLNDLTGVYSASIATAGFRPPLRHGDVNRLTYSEDFSNAAWTKLGTCTVTGTNQVNTPAANDGLFAAPIQAAVPVGSTCSARVKLSGSGTTVIALRHKEGSTTWMAQKTITLTAQTTAYVVTGTVTDATNIGIEFYIRRLNGTTATVVTATEAMFVTGTYTAENFPAYVATTTVPKSNGVGPLWLETDGVDDYLLTNFATPASGHEIIGGRQFNSTAAMRAWAGSGNASKIGVSLGINTSGYPRLGTHNGTTPAVAEITSPAYTPGTPCVLEGEWTPTSQVVRYNGSTEASNTGAVDPATAAQILIGARNSGTWPTVTPADYLAGGLSSIILVPMTLTAAEKLIFRRYAASLEGVTL